MHQMVKEMPMLGQALHEVSNGLRTMASRSETEWPVAQPVAEGLYSIASDVQTAAGTAESAHGALITNNETDIERGEAPRNGRESERRWNL
ncbi:hypothetical protein [Polymorphospora rubra]|nr:hypothetical protein [Polymorphospora rubra]